MSDIKLSMFQGGREVLELSELKGKAVILDLWATWCAPCISSLPAMHDMQTKFGDSVRIILVNDFEKRSVVERFVARRAQITRSRVTLPIALADSIQAKVLLAHDGLPQYYWIDEKGILRYCTPKRDVTPGNVRSFIRTGNVDTQTSTVSLTQALWKSELDIGNSGEGSGLILSVSGASSISCVGFSKDDLYRFAYGTFIRAPKLEQSWIRAYPPLRMVNEYVDGASISSVDEKVTYSFNLLSPPGTSAHTLTQMMRTDLDRYFNLTSRIEWRMTTYVSLTIPDSMRFSGKVAGKANIKMTDADLQWNNLGVDIFIREWESNVTGGKKLFLPNYPLVNETAYKGNVGDIRIEGVDMKDVDKVDKALAPFGVRIELVRKPLEVLVITHITNKERGD